MNILLLNSPPNKDAILNVRNHIRDLWNDLAHRTMCVDPRQATVVEQEVKKVYSQLALLPVEESN